MTVLTEIIHPMTFVGIKGHLQIPISIMSKKMSHVRAETIKKAVLDYYKMPETDFFAKGRKEDKVLARQIFSYLCRNMTSLTDDEISKYVHRDRTTVIHSVEVITDYIKVNNPQYVIEDIENIKKILFFLR